MNEYDESGTSRDGVYSERELFSNLDKDFVPLSKTGALSMLDALLKHPGRLIYEIVTVRPGRVAVVLLGIMTVSMLFYGLIMGSFSGDMQLLLVPVKVTVGLLLSGLICLPSLYIFSSLSGGDQSFLEVAGILLLNLALSSLLLIGFAPVTWIFSQSTGTVGFMGTLHILFWLIAVYFGTGLLCKAFRYLNRRNMRFLKLWKIIFIIVVFQMSTALRPLVGEYEGSAFSKEKKFFLEHWAESF